jgi:hypothetical protein
MIDQHNLSELEEMILLGLREQSIHPQGLNSSHTHGTRYPIGDPRNDEPLSTKEHSLNSSKLMRTGIGSRRNWG